MIFDISRASALRPSRGAEGVGLVVGFRLRGIRSRRAHAMFRFESRVNPPLFFWLSVIRLQAWVANDSQGLYRGFTNGMAQTAGGVRAGVSGN
jgi:hypothetical protein